MTYSAEKSPSVVNITPKRRGRQPKTQTTAAATPTEKTAETMTPVPSQPLTVAIKRALLHGSYYVNQTMVRELECRKSGVLDIELYTGSGVLKVEFAKKPEEPSRTTVYLPPNAWQQLDARLIA